MARQIWRSGNISIHIPHARDDTNVSALPDGADISIHIPHARDDVDNCKCNTIGLFQSTSLMRGMTIICKLPF